MTKPFEKSITPFDGASGSDDLTTIDGSDMVMFSFTCSESTGTSDVELSLPLPLKNLGAMIMFGCVEGFIGICCICGKPSWTGCAFGIYMCACDSGKISWLETTFICSNSDRLSVSTARIVMNFGPMCEIAHGRLGDLSLHFRIHTRSPILYFIPPPPFCSTSDESWGNGGVSGS